MTYAAAMSQANVEKIIGRLVTDEGFRRRFASDPAGTLRQLAECGCDLTWCEQRAIGSIDSEALARFADIVDPRIQRCDLPGERP